MTENLFDFNAVFLCSQLVIHIFLILTFSQKIVALNKTKERMRPYHVNHEHEDPDIKKIKKVKIYSTFYYR